MFDLTTVGSQLVKELSDLVEQSVIVTDKKGFIIASTDPARLNTYHEGASIAMETRRELPMTEEMTAELLGVRPGIVLPIVVSDTPIGVIGITGIPVEIEKYAKLVRKVAELFVTEFLNRQERERGILELELALFELLTAEADPETMAERASILQIDVSDTYRVAVIQTGMTFELPEVERLLEYQQIHLDAKIIRWGVGKLILLIPEMPTYKMRMKLEEFEMLLRQTVSGLIATGVGGNRPFRRLKESFRQAEMAAVVSAKTSQTVFEEELKLELLVYSLPIEVKEEFTERTIGPLMKEPELYRTLKAWLDNNGSLSEVAGNLHIHKNTLKYRLQKIEELLGLDFNQKYHIAIVALAVALQS